MAKRNSVPWYRRPFDPQFMSKEELSKRIEKSYKKANDRLKAIEKANLTKASNAYRYIQRETYDNAEYLTEKGRFRKPTKKMSRNDLLSEYVNLNRFLNESKTSTVKGTKAKYQKAYNRYAKEQKRIGNKPLSFSEYSDFWRSEQSKRLIDMYGSDVLNIISENELDNADLDIIVSSLSPDSDYIDFLDAIEEYNTIEI